MKWIFLLACLLISSCGGNKTLKDSYSPIKERIYEEMTPVPQEDSSPSDVIAGDIYLDTTAVDDYGGKKYTLETVSIEGRIPPSSEEIPLSNKEAAIVLRSQLTAGAIAYSIPDSMKMGNEYLVELRIDDEISKKLSAGLGEDVTVKIVEVSQTMRAEIIGKGFNIDSSFSSSTQLRKFDRPTVWKWGITPTEYGKKTLKMKIVCILKREGFSDETYDLVTYLDTIDVAISPKYITGKLLKENWKSILGFILSSGAVTWIITKIIKKKKGPVA